MRTFRDLALDCRRTASVDETVDPTFLNATRMTWKARNSKDAGRSEIATNNVASDGLGDSPYGESMTKLVTLSTCSSHRKQSYVALTFAEARVSQRYREIQRCHGEVKSWKRAEELGGRRGLMPFRHAAEQRAVGLRRDGPRVLDLDVRQHNA